MKLSNYTILVSDYPQQGQHLVRNTRTQALVKIDQSLKEVITALPCVIGISEEHKKDLEALYREGVLVDSDEDDVYKINNFFDQLKNQQIESVLNITILTTYACNFKCVYCFEEGAGQTKKMSFETAEYVMEWIKNKVIVDKWTKLQITFYGGEPLLHLEIIELISKNFQKWCQENKVGFNFLLQTNGYLLTKEIVQKLKPLGLTSAQITLDGVGDDHNKNRPLKNGQGTFDIIFKNILENIDLIKIGISTVYDRNGIDHIERMLDFLELKNILGKIKPFMFTAVQPSLGKDVNDKFLRMECLRNYDDDVLTAATGAIWNLADKYKLPLKRGLIVSTCSLVREKGGVTIDPHGNIFKCNMMLGHKNLAVGHVSQEEEGSKRFSDLDAWKKCPMDCAYLPICGGGCRLMSFIETRNFSSTSCKRKYLDAVVEDMIKNEYEDLIKKNK